MFFPALLAVAALTGTPAPEMRVTIGDLDFDRPEHISLFVQRTRAASRDYCARHIAFVTPDRMGDPSVCESGMAYLAARALPDQAWERLRASGQLRRFR